MKLRAQYAHIAPISTWSKLEPRVYNGTWKFASNIFICHAKTDSGQTPIVFQGLSYNRAQTTDGTYYWACKPRQAFCWTLWSGLCRLYGLDSVGKQKGSHQKSTCYCQGKLFVAKGYCGGYWGAMAHEGPKKPLMAPNNFKLPQTMWIHQLLRSIARLGWWGKSDPHWNHPRLDRALQHINMSS